MADRNSSDIDGSSAKIDGNARGHVKPHLSVQRHSLWLALIAGGVLVLLGLSISYLRGTSAGPEKVTVQIVPSLVVPGFGKEKVTLRYRFDTPVARFAVPGDLPSCMITAPEGVSRKRDNARTVFAVAQNVAQDFLLVCTPTTASVAGYPFLQLGTGAGAVNMTAVTPVEIDHHKLVIPDARARFEWLEGEGANVTTDYAGATVHLDAALPVWLVEFLSIQLPKVTASLSERLVSPLSVAPELMFLYDAGSNGKIDIEADTVVNDQGGQILIRFSGAGFQQENETAKLIVLKNLAHEAVHLWQLETKGVSQSMDWLHEGAAEALALEALYVSKLMNESDYRSAVQKSITECAAVMKQGPLAKTLARASANAHYACGHVQLLAIARQKKGATVADMWQAFSARSASSKKGMGPDTVKSFVKEWSDNKDFSTSFRRFHQIDYSGANTEKTIEALFEARL